MSLITGDETKTNLKISFVGTKDKKSISKQITEKSFLIKSIKSYLRLSANNL